MDLAPQNPSSLFGPHFVDEEFRVGSSRESPEDCARPATVLTFSTGDRKFSVADVVEAGWFRGDLHARWEEFICGTAAERLAGEKGLEPRTEVLQSLSETFRTEHDLITSEETESWLAARSLTLNDFCDYCHRQYWRRHITHPSPPAKTNYANAAPGDRQLFIKDILFSGRFDALARGLGWRIAVSVAAGLSEKPSSDILESERTRFFQRSGSQPEQLPGLLDLIGRDQGWFESLLELEAGYRRHCDQLLTPKNRALTLAVLRLSLTEFDVKMMDLESEDAAREAFLCLDTDGVAMEALAAQEGCLIEKRRVLLEELPEQFQQRFLSSDPGQTLLLVEKDSRYQVCRVLDKMQPTLSSQKVLERVDHELLASHFGNLAAKHIVWLIGRDPPA